MNPKKESKILLQSLLDQYGALQTRNKKLLETDISFIIDYITTEDEVVSLMTGRSFEKTGHVTQNPIFTEYLKLDGARQHRQIMKMLDLCSFPTLYEILKINRKDGVSKKHDTLTSKRLKMASKFFY